MNKAYSKDELTPEMCKESLEDIMKAFDYLYSEVSDITFDLAINATPVGVYPNIKDKLEIKAKSIIDLIYNSDVMNKISQFKISNSTLQFLANGLLTKRRINFLHIFFLSFKLLLITNIIYSHASISKKSKIFNQNLYLSN